MSHRLAVYYISLTCPLYDQVILKNVTRHMTGQYVCSAANVEGDGFSRPLLITINYKPYCVAPTIQVPTTYRYYLGHWLWHSWLSGQF